MVEPVMMLGGAVASAGCGIGILKCGKWTIVLVGVLLA
ncbi:MAG: hypothetical protein DDT30_01511 [Dehalococcoidia bacterium]|nr:hypothetical protein [Bacillota bacterium]